MMVAVTFGAAAGVADWPDDEAGADDCDVFVLFDEQPPATSAVTMSGYVRKATCFIAYLLLGWQPCRESKHRQAQKKTRSTSWAAHPEYPRRGQPALPAVCPLPALAGQAERELPSIDVADALLDERGSLVRFAVIGVVTLVVGVRRAPQP